MAPYRIKLDVSERTTNLDSSSALTHAAAPTGVDVADFTRVEPPKVLPIADAPNWARTRFDLDECDLDMRIMRGVLGCEHVGISYIRYGPEFRITLGHRHPGGGEEIYVLVEGRARMKVGDTVLSLEAPAALRVHGDLFRAIRADGGAPAVFVVAGTIDDPDETEFAHDFWPKDE